MKRLLLVSLVLVGCGGNDPSRGYLRGTWTQDGAVANIRLWDFGAKVEGWTDDGRRVTGNWPELVLSEPQGTSQVWTRTTPGRYQSGSESAVMEVRR